MQINIDKRSGTFLTIIAIVLVVIGTLLVGQRMQQSDRQGLPQNSQNDGMGMSTSENNDASAFQGNDIMFAQMMIPHHEQAVEISNFALLTSKNSEVLALAKSIRDAQSPEILQMKGWLAAANASTGMDHSMSGGMGGMLSDTEVTTLMNASGSNFDTLFLTGMIAHHEGAIHMTLMIKDSQNSEVKTLGVNIAASQSAQITQMKEILTRIK